MISTSQFLIVRKRYNNYQEISPRIYMYLDKENNLNEFPFPYNQDRRND